MGSAVRNLVIFAVALVALFGLAVVAGRLLDPDAPEGEAAADPLEPPPEGDGGHGQRPRSRPGGRRERPSPGDRRSGGAPRRRRRAALPHRRPERAAPSATSTSSTRSACT